jgi:CheY-like chemotaxis protein/HPt (histidine-containing phosphotransfer) domain-containing protein
MVEDTGIGIPEDKLKSVFETFSQVDSSYRRRYGGTGLGLSISKQLVELMGGDMWVESMPGKGSTFFFTVRFKCATREEVQEYEARSSTRPSAADKRTPARSLRILLAEDFSVNQQMITAILTGEGHRVRIVENGAEALDAVRQEAFDLVLMDVQMPVMDGLEAATAIRQWEATSGNDKPSAKHHLPIIALTAHAIKGDREQCLQAGMDEYLSKPVKAPDLLAVIEALMEAAQNEDVPVNRIAQKKYTSIDIAQALEIMGGQKDILLVVCKAIVEKFPEELARLSHAIKGKDTRSIERIAHAVKSAAKSIGAFQAAELATQIERAGSDNSAEKAVQIFPAFEKNIGAVVQELYDYIRGEEQKASGAKQKAE